MAGKKPFENTSILIVSRTDSIRNALNRVFKNCGAEVYIEGDGHEALRQAKKLKAKVVVFCEDVKHGGAQWFAHQLRAKHVSEVEVIWYIGDKKIALMDGYTKRPFKPVVLVKAIAYNLAVAEDLKKA